MPHSQGHGVGRGEFAVFGEFEGRESALSPLQLEFVVSFLCSCLLFLFHATVDRLKPFMCFLDEFSTKNRRFQHGRFGL